MRFGAELRATAAVLVALFVVGALIVFWTGSASLGQLEGPSSQQSEWRGANLASATGEAKALPSLEGVHVAASAPKLVNGGEQSFSPLSALSSFPRGLGESVLQALHERSAAKAVALADLIRECQTITRDLNATRESLSRVTDIGLQRRMTSAVLEMQVFSGQCQTIRGSLDKARLDLLELARDAGIAGAAAKLFLDGVRAEVNLRALNADARGGDLASLAILSYEKSDQVSISEDDQNIFRMALVMAAADPILAPVASGYLELSKRMYTSAKLGDAGKDVPSFAISKSELASLPMNESKEAAAAAGAIVARTRSRAGL